MIILWCSGVGVKNVNIGVGNVGSISNAAKDSKSHLDLMARLKTAQAQLEAAKLKQMPKWNTDTFGGKLGSALLGGINKDGSRGFGAMELAEPLANIGGMYLGYKNYQLAQDGLEQKRNTGNYNMQNQALGLQQDRQADMFGLRNSMGDVSSGVAALNDSSIGSEYRNLANKYKL
jgi:hypothetical protein